MSTEDAGVSGGPSEAVGFRADGCKVFAGLAQSRPATFESLGQEITRWLTANPEVRIVHLDTKLSPSEGRVWLMIVVFFVGRERSAPALARGEPSSVVEEAPTFTGRSFEPGSAAEAQRMREAAAELFGTSPDPRVANGETDEADDDEGPLDLPPPSDEPLDIRPL